MEHIRTDLLREILPYLDLKTLSSLSKSSKRLYFIINHELTWQSKLRTPSNIPRFFYSAVFDIPISALKSQIFTILKFNNPKKFYVQAVKAISNMKSLDLTGVDSSNNNFSCFMNKILDYNTDHYWISLGSQSSNVNDFLVYELSQQSLIFAINLKFFRAVRFGGFFYPPKSVKISIGNSKENFHYSSDTFSVEPHEFLFTVCILPEIVIGKFVKIELIGKVMTQLGDNKFYNSLSYLDCLGYPVGIDCLDSFSLLEFESTPLEKSVSTGDIDGIVDYLSNKRSLATPFTLDIFKKRNYLKPYLDIMVQKRALNETESFYYVENKLATGEDFIIAQLTSSEMLGNLFEKHHRVKEAKKCYQDVCDI